MTASKQPPSNGNRRTASDQVEAALLNAAERVLDRDGASAVTVRAVAGEAGVAPMGVYNRFANKEGLLTAMALRAFQMLGEAIVVPPDIGPQERFRRICRSYREFALRHPARYALIFSDGSPIADTESSASAEGRAVFGVLADSVDHITSATTQLDALTAAQIVWNALHGAVSLEQAGVDRTGDASATYDQMLDVLLRGLRA